MGTLKYCALSLFLFAVSAQPAFSQGIDLTGSFQQTLVSGGFANTTKTGERFNRSQLSATSGNWNAKASFWNYTFCGWHELDETNLTYSDEKMSLRLGRFLLPVGQTNWDDQWYSNFVFLPLIEGQVYGNHKLLERTRSGVQVGVVDGSKSYQFSAFSSNPQINQLMPDRLDRVTARWTTYKNGTQFGLSALADTSSRGSAEQMLVADVRWTVPHWIVRVEGLTYQSQSQKFAGYFLDVNHRPKNWEDVTLALRMEKNSSLRGVRSVHNVWTGSVKTQLPYDVTLVANYTGGPDINKIQLGGGWSFGLNKTFRF